MTAPDLSPAERAVVDRIEQAPDALGLREEVAGIVRGWFCLDGYDMADALLPLIERREAEAAERGVAVAEYLLRKALDYWDGRPVEHHGHHIYADLCAVLRAITPADRMEP